MKIAFKKPESDKCVIISSDESGLVCITKFKKKLFSYSSEVKILLPKSD